jgi:hypothetical protein
MVFPGNALAFGPGNAWNSIDHTPTWRKVKVSKSLPQMGIAGKGVRRIKKDFEFLPLTWGKRLIYIHTYLILFVEGTECLHFPIAWDCTFPSLEGLKRQPIGRGIWDAPPCRFSPAIPADGTLRLCPLSPSGYSRRR